MANYPRLDSTGLATLLTQLVTNGDGRWAKKTDLASASANGLMSSTDYSKLSGIDTGAQVNTIESVKVNGSALTPDSNKAVDVTVPVLGVQRNGSDLTPDSTTKKVNVEVPVLGVQKNGTDLTPDSTTKKVNVIVPTATSDLTNDSDFQTGTEVESAIAAAIAAAYKPAGTKDADELLPALLIAANIGNVYNITEAGTTTSDFIEGAGKPIRVGDNVGICDVGTGGEHSYKFDLLSGFVDTSDFVTSSDMTTISDADIIAAVNSAFGVSGS